MTMNTKMPVSKSSGRIAAIVIDPTKISKADRNNLCAAFLPAVQRFFEDPANQQKFSEWKQTQNLGGINHVI